jgi:SAM-dependent methyltransferase
MAGTGSRAGWEGIWTSGDIPPRYQSTAAPNPPVVEWAAALPPGIAMLDIGCGVGRHLIYLAGRGFRMAGVDLSQGGIKIAHEALAERGLTFDGRVSDMTVLPWPDRTFGAALSTSTMHHHRRADILRALGEVKRVLKPGGFFYVDFPSTDSMGYQESRDWVQEGKVVEVEPNTFLDEHNAIPDDDAFLPHHYCDEADLRDLLTGFEMQRLWADLRDVTYKGLPAKMGRWIALVRKPLGDW